MKYIFFGIAAIVTATGCGPIDSIETEEICGSPDRVPCSADDPDPCPCPEASPQGDPLPLPW